MGSAAVTPSALPLLRRRKPPRLALRAVRVCGQPGAGRPAPLGRPPAPCDCDCGGQCQGGAYIYGMSVTLTAVWTGTTLPTHCHVVHSISPVINIILNIILLFNCFLDTRNCKKKSQSLWYGMCHMPEGRSWSHQYKPSLYQWL